MCLLLVDDDSHLADSPSDRHLICGVFPSGIGTGGTVALLLDMIIPGLRE
jgi:hypothetical protein